MLACIARRLKKPKTSCLQVHPALVESLSFFAIMSNNKLKD